MNDIRREDEVVSAWERDADETREWVEAIEAVIDVEGKERAAELLAAVVRAAGRRGVPAPEPWTWDQNTIPSYEEPPYPGDLGLEERIVAYMRKTLP